MNARLERKLRALAVIVVAGTIAGLAVNFIQGRTSSASTMVGTIYGLLLSVAIGGVELFVLDGPMRDWLSRLSFTVNLIVRSAIYAAIIMSSSGSSLGEVIAGLPAETSSQNFWSGFIYLRRHLGFDQSRLRDRQHHRAARIPELRHRALSFPVEENRFVLFVDIAGSTGLAERLGGIAIHRFLDHTFRLLTLAVVDYRGEVLNYVGDEVIVTWPERDGAIDCRPLRCFVAMRDELSRASSQFEREFGAAPRIRGSLHFGPVIVGEIGDVKRAIVFNGDVMNTAARLEELSRKVDGGFLASRAAMERFNSAPPFAVRDLGRLDRFAAAPTGSTWSGIDAPVAV